MLFIYFAYKNSSHNIFNQTFFFKPKLKSVFLNLFFKKKYNHKSYHNTKHILNLFTNYLSMDKKRFSRKLSNNILMIL